jgi:hypothetical protein
MAKRVASLEPVERVVIHADDVYAIRLGLVQGQQKEKRVSCGLDGETP